MAKKVIATLKQGKGKEFSLVIKSVKSPVTGAYTYKQEIVHNDHIKDFLAGVDPTTIKVESKPKQVAEEVIIDKPAKKEKSEKKEEAGKVGHKEASVSK